MDTFEVDSDDGSPREADVPQAAVNPFYEEEDDQPDTDGSMSPISPKTKIAAKHAGLVAAEGRDLDMAERKWLQDKWYKLDTSGDGLLDLKETTHLLQDIKRKMTVQQVEKAFDEMDVDGCGSVDFDEFYLWFARQDADQFAHLMSRGAHRQFVKDVVGLVLGMFLPGMAIILLSGPDPIVSFASQPRSNAYRSTLHHRLKLARCVVRASERTVGLFGLPGGLGDHAHHAWRGDVYGLICPCDASKDEGGVAGREGGKKPLFLNAQAKSRWLVVDG